MQKTFIAAALAGLLVSGCGSEESSGPVKRQAGQWKSKIELVRLEGKGVKPEDKAALDRLFGMVSAIAVCVTPEAAEHDTIANNLEGSVAGAKNCTFTKKDVDGRDVSFDGTCTGAQGDVVGLVAKGTVTPTKQDMTVTVTPQGEAEGTVMEMRMTSERTGDCQPGDFTPPAPSATSEKKG